jgi:hypothetical protein
VVDKKPEVTVGLYRLVGEKVNECAEIKAHIQTLMLKALEARAGSAAAALHALIAKGTYKVVMLVHKLKHRTAGLAMYQLAIVADAESMSPELAETFTEIKVNMTAGSKAGEAPRYFTLAMKSESGESGEPDDEEMGGERQGDEADRDEESEVVGRMASVSAGVGARARKRKSIESVESGAAKPVDDELELDEAIEKAMESGRAGLAEDADEDTRIAFFLKGAERINGPGGLEEQIQAKVKAGGIRQLSLSCDALSMELHELEEKQGNLRVAMQEATARVEARKVHSALVQMRMKRQRS